MFVGRFICMLFSCHGTSCFVLRCLLQSFNDTPEEETLLVTRESPDYFLTVMMQPSEVML